MRLSVSVPTSNKPGMKKILAILLCLIVAWSCGSKKEEEPQFTFEGNSGVPGATMYLFGLDSGRDIIDSVQCDDKGAFCFTLKLDTAASLGLITPDGNMVPVYAEPRGKAALHKDAAYRCGWRVDAGETQKLYNSISLILDKCTDQKQVYEKVDSFFAVHPVSEVNTEILRRYIVDVHNPDNKEIRARILKLGGKLQDHEYPTRIKKITDNACSNIQHRSFPSFNYRTIDSTDVALGTYLKKYTLVTFWASWDEASRAHMRKLAAVKDSIRSESFAILNISLDYDAAAWRKRVAEDSIAGDNVHDERTMNSELINKFNIKSLPHTMLVSPYQRVMEYGVNLDNIATRVDSLATRYDMEQERKKKEEAEKKKKKGKSNKKK